MQSLVFDGAAPGGTADPYAAALLLDPTCGSLEQCRAAKLAVIEKSRAENIKLVTLGLRGSEAGRRTLSELADASRGIALWIDEPEQMGPLFFALPDVLGYSARLIGDVALRIETAVDGAFAPGRTVLGTLTIHECPFDCATWQVPIAVRIPENY